MTIALRMESAIVELQRLIRPHVESVDALEVVDVTGYDGFVVMIYGLYGHYRSQFYLF